MQSVPKSRKRLLQILFWTLFVLSLFAGLTVFAHDFVDGIVGDWLPEPILLSMGALIVSGFALFILALLTPMELTLKRFMLLMSGSVIAAVLSVVLHNFLYAMAILAADIGWLNSVLSVGEAGFFVAGVLIFPVLFLIGAGGGMVNMFRHSGGPHNPTPGNHAYLT